MSRRMGHNARYLHDQRWYGSSTRKKRLDRMIHCRGRWLSLILILPMHPTFEDPIDESLEPKPQGSYLALDKRECQFCRNPLPWYRRLFGQLHCSEACQASERFQLSKIAEGLAGN